MYGDDYNIPSVKVAVDNWTLKYKVNLEIVTGDGNVAWIVKKKCSSETEVNS